MTRTRICQVNEILDRDYSTTVFKKKTSDRTFRPGLRLGKNSSPEIIKFRTVKEFIIIENDYGGSGREPEETPGRFRLFRQVN